MKAMKTIFTFPYQISSNITKQVTQLFRKSRNACMVYNESDAKQIIVASTLVIVSIRNNKIFHVNFFSPQTPNSTKCNNRSCTQHLVLLGVCGEKKFT